MALYEPDTYREIVVEPANSWKEVVLVTVAVLALLLVAMVRMHFLPKEEQKLFLQEYHRLDTGLTEAQRPVYQALISSQNEIIMLWEESKVWATVEILDEEGIPPFAVDFMPGNLKMYTWTRYDRGPWVDYIGVSNSEVSGMFSVILRIINLHADFHPHPHPGKDYDPAQKAAVQIWMHSENKQRYPGMRLAERGWYWVVSPDDPVLAPQADVVNKGTQ